MTIQSPSGSRPGSPSLPESLPESVSPPLSPPLSPSPLAADGPTVEVTSDGGCGCGGCGCGGGRTTGAGERQDVRIVTGPRAASDPAPGDLDLRPLGREQRHETVLAAVAALVPGEAFVLAVDHDPAPLRERLLAQEAGELDWTSLQSGPDLWRVQVSRVTCC